MEALDGTPTDALVKGLKAKAGVRYSRADGNGLLVDVTPAGVKSWVFRYRLDGKREKVVIGRYPDVSLKEARAERDKYAAMVRRGKSPFMEKKLAERGIVDRPHHQRIWGAVLQRAGCRDLEGS